MTLPNIGPNRQCSPHHSVREGWRGSGSSSRGGILSGGRRGAHRGKREILQVITIHSHGYCHCMASSSSVYPRLRPCISGEMKLTDLELSFLQNLVPRQRKLCKLYDSSTQMQA